jgi:PAS domain S-box-containing protein
VALAVALLVAAFGLVSFIKLFVGMELNFENLLFPTAEKFGEVLTNRISPLSGLTLFLAGTNLLIILRRKGQAISRHLAGFLGCSVTIIGAIGIVGYIFGTPLLYGGVVVPMALTTALAFLLLGVGLVAGTGPGALPLRMLVGLSTQARLLRAFLPMAVAVVMIQGLLHRFIPALFHNYALGAAVLALIFSLIIGALVVVVGRTMGQAMDLAQEKRKRAEEALRENEERLRAILDATPFPIAVVDLFDDNIHFWSRSALAIFGHTAPTASEWYQLAYPDPNYRCEVIKRWKPFLKRALESSQTVNTGEYRVTCSDGSVSICEIYATFLPDILIVTFYDITERKRAEEALSQNLLELQETAKKLEQSRNMLQLIIESIPVRVFWKDKDSRYLGCNSLFARDAGLSRPEELIGKSDFDMGWQEQAELYRADDHHVMESRHAKMNIIEPQTTPTDDHIWLDTSKVPLQMPNGNVFGVLGVYEDITDRKLAEEKIIRQQEELRGLTAQLAQVEEAERQQLARELHDQVCQNLASINIAIETLMISARRESLDRVLSRLADVGAVAAQTGEITRNIMEGLRPTVLDHYGLMGGVRQFGSKFSTQTGIAMDVRGDELAPRLAAPVELALFRITQEALANVAKHSRATKVVVCHEEKDDTFRLTIADNGVGFDQDKVALPMAGHKWGLMTMTERALAIGGHCQVESVPGQGTRVVVDVPR